MQTKLNAYDPRVGTLHGAFPCHFPVHWQCWSAERQRGIDGEVPHLFQEHKDNLSSSPVLAVEKLSWEFQQFTSSAPQRNVPPPFIRTRLPAGILSPSRQDGEGVNHSHTSSPLLSLNNWAACPSTSKGWARNQQSSPVPGKPVHLPEHQGASPAQGGTQHICLHLSPTAAQLNQMCTAGPAQSPSALTETEPTAGWLKGVISGFRIKAE